MQHLAIIMDGNRRWAHENRLSVVYGHDKGAQTLSEISREVAKLKIPFLTVFAFSSENWRRSKAEVNALFGLMRRYLKQEMSNLMSENIKLRIIGDITPFPKDLRTLFKNAESARTLRPTSSRPSGWRAKTANVQFVLCFTAQTGPPASKQHERERHPTSSRPSGGHAKTANVQFALCFYISNWPSGH